MVVEIDEPVTISAVFSNGKIRPVWFSWRGREIRVRETTLSWKTQEGNARILHFSVTDGKGLYELRFNTVTFLWRIMNADG